MNRKKSTLRRDITYRKNFERGFLDAYFGKLYKILCESTSIKENKLIFNRLCLKAFELHKFGVDEYEEQGSDEAACESFRIIRPLNEFENEIFEKWSNYACEEETNLHFNLENIKVDLNESEVEVARSNRSEVPTNLEVRNNPFDLDNNVWITGEKIIRKNIPLPDSKFPKLEKA